MNSARTIHFRQSGFTLIELVLALAIAGVVLTAINTVFFGALKLRTATIRVAEQTMPVERGLVIIKKDLIGAVPPGTLAGPMGTDVTMNGLNQTPILEMFTSTGIISDDQPWGNVQKIDYLLQAPTNRNNTAPGKDLIRFVTRNLLSPTVITPDSQKVLGGVDTFRFSFFDGTNWNDYWNAQNSNMPVAIEALITFAVPKNGSPVSPPIRFFVPIVTQSNTNLSQTNGASSSTNSSSSTTSN